MASDMVETVAPDHDSAIGEPMLQRAGAAPVTVVGLFEDRIDAEDALVALRRAHETPEQVSLLLRTSRQPREAVEPDDAVARTLAANTLDAVGSWLQGLASLIVPERGAYLVAGPLGAALAGIAVDDDHGIGVLATRTGEDRGAISLLHTFIEFGFGDEEASYLEHRLAAGAVVVAVTSSEAGALQASRRLFADHNAVHIGQAHTDAQLAAEASALLAAAPEASRGGDVVVADAVAALRHVCGGEASGTEDLGACGVDVVDDKGQGIGTVSDLLADPASAARPAIRYVVIGYGGLLGLGRHFVAVPAALVDVTQRPARAQVDRDLLHHSPRYDPNTPFSRRLEAAVCAYFGATPYWEQD